MIPLVFILAAIFIVVAIVLFAVDRRRRSPRAASATPSTSATPSLHDESSSSDHKASDVAAGAVESAQDESGPAGNPSPDSELPPVPQESQDSQTPQDPQPAFADDDSGDSSGLGNPEGAPVSDLIEAGATSGANQDADITPDADYAPESNRSSEPELSPEPTLESEPKPEPVPAPKPAPKPEPKPEPEPAPTPEHAPEPVSETASAPEPKPAQPPRPTAPERRRLSGRKIRHLRKLWAQQRNASYSRVDHELPSYWQRTPDGDAKAVVSGFAFGREMHLADIDGIATIAIRRSVASEEVFEVRRSGGTDLPHVATEAGLIVAATNPELIHRIFDDRATRMLVDVHPAITRMWCEGAWSLAQLVDGSATEDWEGALTSLSEFSDIVRRLPPGEGETVAPDTSQWDPTRAQLTTQPADAGLLGTDGIGRGHLQAVPNAQGSAGHGAAGASRRGDSQAPLDVEEVGDAATSTAMASSGAAGVEAQGSSESSFSSTVEAIDSSSWRPARDTPLNPAVLPTRSTARKMGAAVSAAVGESEEIGESGQSIPALGQDPEHSHVRSSQGRVVRSNVKPASIFTDAQPGTELDAESNTEPSADLDAEPDARPSASTDNSESETAPDSADD